MSDEEEALESFSNVPGFGGVSGRHQIVSLPPVPANQGPPSISLAYLIDFAVQRTFQDLTVLSELLPKKSDMERKISIVQFAHSTRQLFIRLLSVVRWAKNAGKVDLCTGISYFLDQQASIFVETADRLFQLSREVLPQARLPAFQIPAAVDILVLGSYPRLPACIKTRFVPDEPVTLKEQACVLRRLNQVIQHRLVFATVPLPGPMQNFTIRNGMVNFTVTGEFEASLTLLGEEPNLPWSLLNIKILVEDYDIGEGAALVHPFQVHYIHELVEARIVASDNPIAELYDVLHTFCVCLQLDILFCQASKFVHDRMIEYISVDEYVQGQKLTMTYWKNATKRRLVGGGSSTPVYPGFNYKLAIQVESTEGKKVLRVSHIPSADVRLPSLEDYNIGRGAKLNIESLLCDTMVIRIRHRLVQLKQRLDGTLAKKVRLMGTVPTLEVFLLEPLVDAERLDVSINLFTGHFVCSVGLLEKRRVLEDVERLLNLAQWQKIGEKLYDLKTALLMERYRKMAVGLPVVITDTVPLLPNSATLRFLSSNRLLFRFARHDSFYLVVEFLPDGQFGCKTQYFLLSTCSANSVTSTLDVDKGRDISGVCEFVKPVTMLLLDARALTPAPTEGKVRKGQPHLSTDLAAVVTKCEQRMPFILLCDEFDKKGIKYQPPREEEGVGCIVLNVLGFTNVPNKSDKPFIDALWNKGMVRLAGRLMHDRNRVHWTFELIMRNIPIYGTHQRHGYGPDNKHQVRMTVLNNPVSTDGASKCADDLLNAMCAFGRFFDLVVRFAPIFDKCMQDLCQVISLSINRLVLSYGPGRQFFVLLQWKQQESNFHLSFGTHAAGNGDEGQFEGEIENRNIRKVAENPHTLLASFIQSMFNDGRDLANLMQYLNDTIQPLLSLQILPQYTTSGVGENTTPGAGVGYGHVFSVLPVSGTLLRIIYKWHYCFQCQMMANGEVIVRDCGAAQATTATGTKITNRFAPIVGFKSFFVLHEQLAGTYVANVTPSQLCSAPASVAGSTGSPVRQPVKQESFDKSAGSPLKSVKAESPSSSYPAPSPAGVMIAPSPLTSSASLPGHQRGGTSHGPMTPSPAPASLSGLLTPSPAAGPSSNAGMLMTPSPATFPLQSPAPAAAQSVSSTGSASGINNAPPLSPAGPEPAGPEQSPLSFMQNFAKEASAAGTESKGNGGDFSNWGDFSTVASMTPVTTSAPFSIENLPITQASQQILPVTSSSNTTTATAPSTATLNTDEWAPSAEPIIISHAAFQSACSVGADGNSQLKGFLGSICALDKLPKQPNAIPVCMVSGPGQANSKVGSLEMKMHLDDKQMAKLCLKVVNTVDGGDMWSEEDLRVMEQYFAEYVAPLQHHHAITTFLRFLLFSRTVHSGAPKSLVALMRHQLQRDMTKPWSASLCLLLPPPHLMTPPLTTIGQGSVIPGSMAIMVNREQRKMLLWIKLTSNMDRKQKWIFPLLYDGETNGATVFTGPTGAVQHQSNVMAQYPIITEVNSILQRHQSYSGDCSIWTSVNGLAGSLSHQHGSDESKV